ncbi:putative DEP domain-containing mTOR-interacting protein [Hypsibius exemplaris]|uniref:DEP domain-containing mTOR-interacting protein n=1 Tax=Hypsibius exemplaris TaxID=2072580 RepID=A0A1W0X9C5_HYPEX|nr:putative DEP domain-containing mTOR-interacting protein [Hypsibius exemplaris]
MHLAPDLVRDRRHHLRVYSCSFDAADCLSWLIEENEAPSRVAAVFLMNILQKSRILHHVTDDHLFKDQHLFFRFRQDDNTFPVTQVTRLFFFAQRLHDRLHSEPQSCLRKFQAGDKIVADAFKGAEFAQWLIRKNESRNLDEAVVSCQQLLDAGLIKCLDGVPSAKFRVADNFYNFAFDFNYRRRLHDLFLLPNVQKEASMQNIKFLPKTASAYEIYPGFDSHGNGSLSPMSPTPTLFSDTSSGSGGSPSTLNPFRPAFERRHIAQAERMLEPDSGFVRKVIQVESDAVGYGFVLRGASPCYIQTVDPDGPAHKAGVKVGQYLYSVNDIIVFDRTHKDVASVIVDSHGKIRLVVFAEGDSPKC